MAVLFLISSAAPWPEAALWLPRQKRRQMLGLPRMAVWAGRAPQEHLPCPFRCCCFSTCRRSSNCWAHSEAQDRTCSSPLRQALACCSRELWGE